VISVVILGFLSGMLAAAGVPHFVKGITGSKHQTPFGKPSSAVVNVVWGWINFVVAVLLWHIAPMHIHPRLAFLAVAAGGLVMGVVLANSWSMHPEFNKEKSR